MQNKQEFHIPITHNDKTAVEWLAEESGFSRQKLKQYMQKGCVWLERADSKIIQNDVSVNDLNNSQHPFIKRLRRAKKILNENDTLHFYYDESVLNSETPSAILIEDLGDYSIWNKPSGMFSQGSKWGDHCTVYRWAEKNLLPERAAFIVHRLDRAANGLIIVAHKKSVARQFSKMFELREVDKYYQAIVEGDFNNKISNEDAVTINTMIDGKTAVSHFTLLDFNATENTSTLEVIIETGRKHQIRKHLAEAGFPIVGDRLYGSEKHTVGLQLQAKALQFICPVTTEKRFFTLDS